MENETLNVDQYISNFPDDTRELLNQMREAIKESAPDSEEVISYKMPAYKQNGMLVYFAGYTKHIGFYPTGSGISHFKEKLSMYKGAKGSVQFPLDKPLPLELISEIVKFRVQENLGKSLLKKSK
jgi:uncharacterized protein YdhG (YjbR/CyaY superfamily)